MIQDVESEIKVSASFVVKPELGRLLLCLGILFVFCCLPKPTTAQTDSDIPLFKIEFTNFHLIVPCPKWCIRERNTNPCNSDVNPSVDVRIKTVSGALAGPEFWYEFLPDKGEIRGEGEKLFWDLARVGTGRVWLKVKINKGFETVDVLNEALEITKCECTCEETCAVIEAESNVTETKEQEIVLFRAIQRGCFSETATVAWKVENGTIISGQGTGTLKVRAGESGLGDLKVTVELVQQSWFCTQIEELSVRILPKD